MRRTKALYLGVAAVGIAVLLAACAAGPSSSPNT